MNAEGTRAGSRGRKSHFGDKNWVIYFFEFPSRMIAFIKLKSLFVIYLAALQKLIIVILCMIPGDRRVVKI